MIDIPLPWVINAVLLLARTAGLVTFVPLPGSRQFPALPKAVLALTLAVLLLRLCLR